MIGASGRRNPLRYGLVLAFLLLHAAVSWAQTYPDRPVRMVVAQPAGGTMDANARAVSQLLARELGQNIVVDNRGGANGILAGETLATAPPDGHTLLYTTNSTINNQVIHKKLPFDVLRDFAPVTGLLSLPGYLVVANPQLSARTVPQLIKLSVEGPGRVNFGSGGIGNSQHLAGALLNVRAGAKLEHVPYKGFGQVVTAVLGNEVQIAFAAPPSVLPHLKAGRLVALGYTGAKRWAMMPELPTVAESVPGYVFEAAWHGMFAPAKTPRAIVERLYAATAKVLQVPALREQFTKGGYVIVGSSPPEFRKFVAEDLKQIAEICRVANIKAE
jgi:tripartite-type tricarboxylate transporter receptor subunit TctC